MENNASTDIKREKSAIIICVILGTVLVLGIFIIFTPTSSVRTKIIITDVTIAEVDSPVVIPESHYETLDGMFSGVISYADLKVSVVYEVSMQKNLLGWKIGVDEYAPIIECGK